MTNSEVREWIRFACECNGCPELAAKIPVEWSGRMTRAMGRAFSGRGYKIKLSRPLFARATPEQQRQTVIHEACHIVEAYKGTGRMSHGPQWARYMRAADCAPERCHHVSTAGLRKRFVYTCPNGCHEYKLSTRLHNGVQRGQHRICPRCKERVAWTGKII